MQQLIDMQMNEYTPDSAIQEKQAELSQLYDNFAKCRFQFLAHIAGQVFVGGLPALQEAAA